ncbi:addiction module toxin, Txe/YoeB family [Maricaulis maris MCS10]|uniref:Putative mRNA interferase YoeB n=1 Tax=Maricaulis maris (strain MCS10) TaxID=394221 RepID=Q0ANU2_MARMM|nr:Txe/YoeB family addiction module toxin [Maricaulis maris]ABI66045.1 addiction module toxin, Txe/YoeB family [Maricaulis maris MCS10]
MNVELTPQALDDLAWLVRHETRLAKRALQLIEDIRRNPFDGLGKPEPLKGELSGWWSRRIDSKHRLVYRVVGAGDGQRVEVVQCRRHY